MTDNHMLVAFLATVAAIIALSLIGALTAAPTDLAVMTGLIGILGTFRPRTNSPDTAQDVNVTNTKRDPVQTEQAKSRRSPKEPRP